jgi:hypothetical protein
VVSNLVASATEQSPKKETERNEDSSDKPLDQDND